MPCEKYQDALIDLAAGGSEVISAVREHLNVCASCRSYLEQEQVLFASVDSGVRQTINAPLPASLLQRFQPRLAQETSVKLAPRMNWTYAAVAAFALVGLTLLILGPQSTPERRASKDSPEMFVEENAAAGPTLSAPLPLSFPPGTSRAVRRTSQTTQPLTRPARIEGPQILVSPEERDAFARFISNVSERKELAAALVSPSPEKETEALKVEALQISWLEIEPLQEPRMSPISER